jgi:hypothetical protein
MTQPLVAVAAAEVEADFPAAAAEVAADFPAAAPPQAAVFLPAQDEPAR